MDTLNEYLTHLLAIDCGTAYFPIRHHSPACAYHLEQAIKALLPDCILIEGPMGTDPLIDHILAATPPVAVYYSYRDSGRNSGCYFPLLSYSPEYVALQMAAKKGIPAHFIDLSHGSRSLLEQKRDDCVNPNTNFLDLHKKGVDGSKDTYYDDYYLQRSQYIKQLCIKENCRDESELWEKMFEIGGMKMTTADFVKSLATFCYYSRVGYPDALLEEELMAPREEHMAAQILHYQKTYRRILVVTGGFHTHTLTGLVTERQVTAPPVILGETYLIPYSYQECDQLNGYQSGMPYPGFYDCVYQNMRKAENPFQKTVMQYIVRLCKELKHRNDSISISEEAAAFEMALGLSRLRDKAECGVYEFLDGVRSCFIKGEVNASTWHVLEEAKAVLTGKVGGKVAEDTPIPPIVLDFYEKCKRYQLDITSMKEKEKTLDIIANMAHREQSVFFHRLTFLGVNFANKTYGPNYQKRSDVRLIREKWRYFYRGEVSSVLIEHSSLGSTIEEACVAKLSQLIKNRCSNAAQAAELLLQAGVLGLIEQTVQLTGLTAHFIKSEPSFLALADCITTIYFLLVLRPVLRISGLKKIEECLHSAFFRSVYQLPGITAANEKEDIQMAEMICRLYQISCEREHLDKRELCSALAAVIRRNCCSPALEGAAAGVLYCAGQVTLQEVLRLAAGYFWAAGEIRMLSGRFLRGLVLAAKDLFFYDNGFLEGLNHIISELSYDEFLQLLPDLRLCFANFIPRETQQLAQKVLSIIGSPNLSTDELLRAAVVDERSYQMALKLDAAAYQYLAEIGGLEP